MSDFAFADLRVSGTHGGTHGGIAGQIQAGIMNLSERIIILIIVLLAMANNLIVTLKLVRELGNVKSVAIIADSPMSAQVVEQQGKKSK